MKDSAKKINILITGAGSPGIACTIYSLKNNYENRKVKIVCTDIKDQVVGKYLSDKFYSIPNSLDKSNYLNTVLDICIKENIDVLFPQNTSELLHLSENLDSFDKIGTKVIVSDYNQMLVANDKFELLRLCELIDIPIPTYYMVQNSDELKIAANLLDYPEKPIVVKPPKSNGSRGIRIIDENKNYKDLFYNEKPTSLYIKLLQLIEILGNEFPPLLIMEYLPGDEITIDVFRDVNQFISIPRIREEVRSGISFKNYALNSAELIGYSKKISEHIDLKYCYGFQFKYDSSGIPKILECNPRVQGTMIFATLMGANMIYFSVKSALGEQLPEISLDWNTKLIRYWGAVGLTTKGVTII